MATEPDLDPPGQPSLPLPAAPGGFTLPASEPIPDSFSFDTPRDPQW